MVTVTQLLVQSYTCPRCKSKVLTRCTFKLFDIDWYIFECGSIWTMEQRQRQERGCGPEERKICASCGAFIVASIHCDKCHRMLGE